MQSNHFTITVSGGDTDSNRKMTCAVHDALRDHNFADVEVDLPDMHHGRGSVADLVRALDPELLKIPVRIVPETLETRRATGAFDFCAEPFTPVAYDFAR